MVELAVLAVFGVIAFGVLAAGISLFCWLFFPPFRILGLVFRGLPFLLVLPLLLVAAVFGVVIFGFGALIFLFPAVPLLLLVAGIWWLATRRRPGARTVSV